MEDILEDNSEFNGGEGNKTKNKKKTDKRVRRVGIQWTPESVQKLIDAVEQHESLWNVKSQTYKNRDAKENAWSEVAAAVDSDKTEALIKWNSLRVTYRVNYIFY